MKNIKSILFILLGVALTIAACEKALQHEKLSSNDEKNYRLISHIEKSTGISVKQLNDVKEFTTAEGIYRVIEFTNTADELKTLVQSDFALDLGSENVETLESGGAEDRTGGTAKCYEYWCNTAGNCETCNSIIVVNGSTTTIRCSCETCHLVMRTYDCATD